MNGDELLTAFVAWLEKTRPERFFPLQYFYDEEEEFSWKRSKMVPNYSWSIAVAKECCYGAYDAILYRKLDGVTHEVIPLEVKSDADKLDDRLRAQLWVHIKNYGKSMLLLGKEQAVHLRTLGLKHVLPTEIWEQTPAGEFRQLTEPINKFYQDGCSNLSKRALQKAFGLGDYDSKVLRRLQVKAMEVRAVLCAIEFNQYSFGEERKFTAREAELAKELFATELQPEVCKPKPAPLKEDVSSVAATGFSPKGLQTVLASNKEEETDGKTLAGENTHV